METPVMESEPIEAKKKLPWWQRWVIGRHPKRTLVRIIVLVVVIVVVIKYVLIPIKVSGDSMAPSYRDGRINFVNRLAYVGGREPARGDVVAIRTSGISIMLLKRIVGLPGEHVALVEGRVFIEGEPLPEPYVKKNSPEEWEEFETTVDAGHYFVIGDNRSIEKRYFVDDDKGEVSVHWRMTDAGEVPVERIVGRILF